MTNADNEYDVVIAGGGLVGLSLAAALGKADFSVAVLEAREPVRDWPADSVDLRVYAITRASQRLFESVGAWSAIEPHAGPFRDMRVWDAGGTGDIHFSSADLGEPYLGHIIESRVIETALLDVVDSLPAVQRLCPAVVQGFESGDEQQTVELEDGRRLTAKLLVGADGKASRIRDQTGIKVRAADYGQQALVAVVSTGRPHEETAWQRFLPTGPLAFLPLADGRSSIVWSATSHEAERLLALDETEFCAELTRAFDRRLGEVTGCGERVLFPLRRQHAERYIAPRIALVGDASHVIHPLAGQGVNLGLKDAGELAATLSDARARERDIGSMPVLRRYERARRGDNAAMMLAMDGFKHLFGSRIPPLRWMRNAGLNLVDAAPLVKNQIMRSAMGL
ncbi:MAG TPA: 2-octaprenyl-3-methyl-6-methoxy-1,4-benzoquinol hydroxylase [Gammaproteobacteria bacterium]|nr:2-octaprenyl-3-methyl-6-methoxy-1,4-benzoquinol hydroxylase [Gammaproteobacteria bacterium]